MAFNAEWITHKGTITDDNRDHCAIALRGPEALYVVADGSTKGDQSGDLAKEFVRKLADRFITEPYLSTVEEVTSFFDEMSKCYRISYPAGRLSFLVLLDLGDSSIVVIHAGDCRLGRIGVDNEAKWLSRAHTLANATKEIGDEALSQHDSRHLLTRCFRPGKSCEMEIRQYSLMAIDQLVIATDGYWADLNSEQKAGFIAKKFKPSSAQRDDSSCLVLSRLSKGSGEQVTHQRADNFYVVKS